MVAGSIAMLTGPDSPALFQDLVSYFKAEMCLRLLIMVCFTGLDPGIDWCYMHSICCTLFHPALQQLQAELACLCAMAQHC